MTSTELREKFLKFFEAKAHVIVPSASLIPKEDPSVLFTTAGMQQFKPYYTNPEAAPAKNVVSIQKCVRTSDIDQVGDDTHLTFFEMLGNFSFGGYGKVEAIKLALDFLEKELNIDHSRISATYFGGDSGLKLVEDTVSRAELATYFVQDKIKAQGSVDNFWGPTGDEGPCGPTVELYVDGVEVWNLVFNEFYKSKDGKYASSETKGVDTGMGLERTTAVLEDMDSLYDTELFLPLVEEVKKLLPPVDLKSKRIIADHIRASVFLLSDGVEPSNKDRGYVLRRLIRRAITRACKIDINFDSKAINSVAERVVEHYKEYYPELNSNKESIFEKLSLEARKFRATLDKGLKTFLIFTSNIKTISGVSIENIKEFNGLSLDKIKTINGITFRKNLEGKDAFNLFETYGFPKEVIKELCQEINVDFDEKGFEEEFKTHQELSRTTSSGRFKGGLASHSDKIVRLHTATHLLNAALRKILGDQVWQKGSNITEERTRFDFTHDQKMTNEEKKQVENLVNDWVAMDLSVKKEIMALEEARKLGALGVFGEKYQDQVSVYTIYRPGTDEVISREFCGGPHVEQTGSIGKFKLLKEEAVSAGVRRIKATVE